MKSNINGMEIAVIGVSGKFPGAENVQEYWQNIKQGLESISFFTEEELLEEGERKENIDQPNYVKANSFLKGKQYFDSSFFDYLPDEARLMDPQMRVFHECVWNAMEDAGYVMSNYEDKIGVFAGGSGNVNWQNYAQIMNLDQAIAPFGLDHISNIKFLCSRLSYLFNLTGPSLYVDTACSTSLVAIQRASMSLLLGECSMAIAGGVSIGNTSKKGYFHREGVIYSKDGHCKTFDADASGTISGEGVGAVVLKRLQEAIADNDNIYAVIKGSAINNDGNNKVGYTAPSVLGQYQAHLKARKMAGIEAESISYIEAHGTATPLGDPIEVEALNMAFGKSTEKYCGLGSVKSNIGHLDSAAGVAGFIKTVLALKHKQIPPSLNFKSPNPKINFKDTPFYVNTELKEWKSNDYPLRAGVSSFGIGGTNAHVILEEAPVRKTSSASRPFQVLKISAKSAGSLQRNAENLSKFLEQDGENELPDIAYTLNVGRSTFPYRKVLICKDKTDAISQLKAINWDRKIEPINDKVSNKTAFMFPGQGSQHVNMCIDLYRDESSFRLEVDNCFEIVRQLSGKDLKGVVFSKSGVGIDDLEYALPLLFTFEYSLARLLMSWGIVPDVLIGHSNAEYVAACLGGVFTVEDALRLIVKRGELMQKMPRGKMLSVSISDQELKPYLNKTKDLSLAAVNSSSSCVVSGPEDSVINFQEHMEAAGFTTKLVRSSHAGHSAMMEGMLDEYRKELKEVSFSPQQIPFISNLTGKSAKDAEVSQPEYWIKHLRHTVKFSEGISEIMQDDQVLFLEVGPGKVMGSFVGANSQKGKGHKVINLLGHPKEPGNDFFNVFTGLGKIWQAGVQPDWTGFYSKEDRRKVSLPTYSFDKIKYPVNVDAAKMVVLSTQPDVSTELSECLYAPGWESSELIVDEDLEQGKHLTLIFKDETGVGDLLREELEDKGDDVICITQGGSFNQINDQLIEINPNQEKDYVRLFESIQLIDQQIRIIFAWGLSVFEQTDTTQNRVREKLDTCYFGLLNISRALSSTIGNHKVEITSITNHLHQVLSEDKVSPEKSPLIGAIKVIPKEYTNFTCRNIDINLSEIGDSLKKKVIEDIIFPDEEQLIAYRLGTRFGYTLKQVKVRSESKEIYRFIEGGVYLITGGVGGLGLTFARKIAEEVAGVKLILLGRKELPQKESWQEWLKKYGKENSLYDILKELVAIEAMGGNVYYSSVNLSDSKALQDTISDLEQITGPVNGVIHTAGIGDFAGVIHKRTKQDCEKLFEAKIYGTIALQEAMNGNKLDFTVLCSSFSSITAPFGQVGYAAANLFLESFGKHHASANGSKMISIGWNQWQDVGIAAKEISNNKFSLSQDNVTPEQGYEVLKRCLKVNQPEIFITRFDPHRMARSRSTTTELKVSNELVEGYGLVEQEGSIHEQGNLEERLLTLWQTFFGKDDLSIEDDFFEIGGDSLKALTMTRRINMHFNVEISLVEFFKHSTIILLSDYISTLEGDEFIRIPIAKEKPHYHLSSAQRRLYFLYEFDKSSLAYNMPQIVRLAGGLGRNKLEGVFKTLIDRHEILRTSMQLIEDEVVQKVHKEVDFKIEFQASDQQGIQSIIKDFIRPFDLSDSPLIRVGLIQVSEVEHVLMVDVHHIVSDGASQGIMIKDFMSLYNDEELRQLDLQYKDYSEWQRNDQQQERLVKQKEYWLQEFSEEVEVLDLPTDHLRPRLMDHSGGMVSFTLDKAETDKLRSLCQSESVTMFMTILSVFNVLLSKLSNGEDIVIGTPTAGRSHADLEGMIGMFVNTLALRNYPKGEKGFKDFLSEVKEKTLQGFDNQAYQYEELIDALNVPRETNRNPLFDVMFVFQNFETQELTIPGLSLEPYSSNHLIAKFDLTLSVMESANELYLNIRYSTELFSEATIERFISYFKWIVTSVTSDATVKLSDIDILPEEDRHQLLYEFNDTAVDYPREKTIVDLFEEQVKKTPDRVALSYKGKELSYTVLNAESNRLAHYLRDRGVVPDQVVGILLEDPIGQIVSILGVLKSGGCYLPIDVTHPTARIEYVLQNSGSAIVITTETLKSEHDQILGSIETVLISDVAIPRCSEDNLGLVNKSSDLAYIIYTSGTTGQPKGAMIEHGNVVRLFFNDDQLFDFTETDVWTMFHSYSFDFSVWEMYGALLHGGKLVLISREDARDPSAYLQVLKEHQVTILNQTPTAFHNLLTEEKETPGRLLKIRQVIFGGEKLIPTSIRDWKEKYPETQMINMYGITETTVHVTYKELKEDDIASNVSNIGVPIPTTQVYILDEDLNLCIPGVKGEMYVGGSGVCRGYLNNTELTSERFIVNPFQEGELIYSTGDLARWLPKGELEYLGRIDSQVQIRGFRIELGEIESQLLSHESIKEVVVLSKSRVEETYLVGYYVSEDEISTTTLRGYLSEKLPDYMLPAYYVHMDRLPLTSNGKIDRRSLPEEEVKAGDDYIAPRNEKEKVLCEIWSKGLGVKSIGIRDNFFAIGGDSIKVIKIVSQTNKLLNSKINIADVFANQTVEQIALIITNDNGSDDELRSEILDEFSALKNKILNHD